MYHQILRYYCFKNKNIHIFTFFVANGVSCTASLAVGLDYCTSGFVCKSSCCVIDDLYCTTCGANGCTTCMPGYYLKQDGTCALKIINGGNCNAALAVRLDYCTSGFVCKSSCCVINDLYCTTCGANGCTTCMPGYYLKQDGTCVLKIVNGGNCNAAQAVGLDYCTSGFVCKSSCCVIDDLYCTTCGANGCTTCMAGYYLKQDGTCALKIVNGGNCTAALAVGLDFCASGLTVACQIRCCKFIDPSCASCDPSGSCTTCVPGYISLGGVCVAAVLQKWDLRDSSLRCTQIRAGVQDCSSHALTVVPSHISGTASVIFTEIDLHNNLLTIINPLTFANMANLVNLNLDGNLIQSIGVNAFSNCSRLSYLLLSNNQINYIGLGAFSLLPQIQFLSLNGNQLSIFNASTYDSVLFNNLRRIDVGNNPIQNYLRDMLVFISTGVA